MATFFSVGTSMADLGVPGVCGVLEQLGVPGVPGVREAQLGGVPGVMAVEPGVVGVEVPLFPVLLRIGSDPTGKNKKNQHQTHRNTAALPSAPPKTASLCAKQDKALRWLYQCWNSWMSASVSYFANQPASSYLLTCG